MSVVLRCCDRLSSRTFLEIDGDEDRSAKRLLVPALALAVAVFTVFTIAPPRTMNLKHLAGWAGVAAIVLFPLAFRWTGRRWSEAVVLFFVGVVAAMDIAMAADIESRFWSTAVLLLDVALVTRSRRWVVKTLLSVVLAVVWLVVSEQAFSYGLFELTRLGSAHTIPHVCDCASPPCAAPVIKSTGFGGYITVTFVLDFYFTRRFAMAMQQQIDLMSAAVATCDELTGHLARYEVEAATAVLDGSSGERLPPELRESYRRLLANLDSYRPYLPDSLLLDEDCDASVLAFTESAAIPAPGEGQEEADVCIVFTDIQSSSALWEEFHQGMYKGLQLHNAVLRRVAGCCGGYEVKTIGDAFMLAFSDVRSAAEFALTAQRQLMEAEWPAELLQSPLCRRIECSSGGGALWKGLRVRMGIHCGTVKVERNPVTGRCDYFGTPVNVAARVEAEVRKGGLVGVTEDALDQLGNSGLLQMGALVHPMGTRKLRGVAAAVPMHLLLPQELQERRDETERDRPLRRTEFLDDVLSPTTSSTDSTPRNSTQVLGGIRLSRMNSVGVSVGDAADNSRLALQLKQTVASCAAVTTTLRPPTVAVSATVLVTAVERAADVSQGVLQSVLSAGCVVTWNAPRACAGHAAQCAHFLSVLQRHADAAGVSSWTGATSGAALSGNIAGKRRRFATVVGGCVELSGILSTVAEAARVRAVVSGLVAGHCGGSSLGHLRTAGGRRVLVRAAKAADAGQEEGGEQSMATLAAQTEGWTDEEIGLGVPDLWGIEEL
eukprot:TRINITY_DN535_c3_g2_i7.p1 TRINITY_DN535_c3_g2~~TRINITY_DN535_c3_g2_i7.p1  ORF type:complete len:775 (+),score=243.89 TRINITY_DN535_c3_g2_i7:56-2380(+)